MVEVGYADRIGTVIIAVMPSGEYIVTEVTATEDISSLPNLIIRIPTTRPAPIAAPPQRLEPDSHA